MDKIYRFKKNVVVFIDSSILHSLVARGFCVFFQEKNILNRI